MIRRGGARGQIQDPSGQRCWLYHVDCGEKIVCHSPMAAGPECPHECPERVADALKATRSYVNKDGLMVESLVPDHSRDAVALLGGIPKVGEGTPRAHGLNLFIAVDADTRHEAPP